MNSIQKPIFTNKTKNLNDTKLIKETEMDTIEANVIQSNFRLIF